jgi:hypothetical protein
MWQRGYGAPPCPTKDIRTTTCTDGRKVHSDSVKQPPPSLPAAHGTGAIHAGTPQSSTSDVTSRSVYKQQEALSRRKKQKPGRRHQSVAMIVKNNPHFTYKKCPGLNIEKETTQTYKTNYRCEECSIDKGTNVWLCNAVKKVDGKQKKIECHIRYHAEKEFIAMTTTECNVISDLTDES